jgi:hypothetical protein
MPPLHEGKARAAGGAKAMIFAISSRHANKHPVLNFFMKRASTFCMSLDPLISQMPDMHRRKF